MTDEELLTQIGANWSGTDVLVYKTPGIKLKSLKAAETRVYARDKIAAFVEAQKKPEPVKTVAEMKKIINKQNRENGNSKTN